MEEGGAYLRREYDGLDAPARGDHARRRPAVDGGSQALSHPLPQPRPRGHTGLRPGCRSEHAEAEGEPAGAALQRQSVVHAQSDLTRVEPRAPRATEAPRPEAHHPGGSRRGEDEGSPEREQQRAGRSQAGAEFGAEGSPE
jgi:hypothetical protein